MGDPIYFLTPFILHLFAAYPLFISLNPVRQSHSVVKSAPSPYFPVLTEAFSLPPQKILSTYFIENCKVFGAAFY
jgi:hypothetical protein